MRSTAILPLLCYFTLILLFVEKSQGLSFPSQYSNQKYVKGLSISWEIIEENYVSFLVSGSSSGWLALGFEPFDVGMNHSDIVVAKQNPSGAYEVRDYWTDGYSTPVFDTSLGGTDDIQLYRTGNNDGLWMEFIRPIYSFDKFDKSLPATRLTKVTWAYSSSIDFVYHQKNRGFVLLDIFSIGACIKGCNGNGDCSNGVCTCYSGRTGVDCSAQIPPTNLLIQSPTDQGVSSKVINSFLTLYWKHIVTNHNQILSIWLECKLQGWVGIGFNPADRGMTTADMVIASLIGNYLSVGDYWSPRIGTPYLDTLAGGTTDIFPLVSYSDTGIDLKFARYINSRDRLDHSISDKELTKVVWAHGPEKALAKHNSTNRGFVWVDFFNTGACPNRCSDHGTCSAGICACENLYAGDDCSVETYSSGDFPATMDFTVALTPYISLSWTYINSTHIAFSMSRLNGVGWIGLSIGAEDGMTNADMVICTIVSSAVVCQDYWSSGFRTPQLDTDLGGKNSVSYYYGKITENSITVKFIRPILAQDRYDISIPPNGSVPVAYAFGDTNSLSKHATENRQVVNINFESGTQATSTRSVWYILRITHGAIMFLAWGVFLFFGAIWVTLTRDESGTIGDLPKWFFVHRITQYIGYILSLSGWIIGVVMVKLHFQTLFHGQLGICLICLSIFQVVAAFFRPHPPAKTEEKSTFRKFFEIQHAWTGRLMILISIACIISGLLEIGAHMGFLIAYITYVGVFFLGAVVYKLCSHFRDTNYSHDKQPLTNKVYLPSDSKIVIDPVGTSIPPPDYNPAPPVSLKKGPPPPSDIPEPPPPTSPFSRAMVNNTLLPKDDSDSDEVPLQSMSPPEFNPATPPHIKNKNNDQLPSAPNFSPQ